MFEIARDPRGVATLFLKRARTDGAMIAALTEALHAQTTSPGLRALVLRGEGKHFCTGADINWLRHCIATGETPTLSEALLALDRLPCPVVTVVHGGCVGAGVGFAAVSDIVLATPDAFFAVPEVRVGLPAAAIAPLLVRSIGLRQARRYALSGERFDALTALRLGLVHAVHPADAMPQALEDLLAALLAGAPAAQADTKRTLAASGVFDDTALDLDAQMPAALRGPEATEGFRAFAEHRAPVWR